MHREIPYSRFGPHTLLPSVGESLIELYSFDLLLGRTRPSHGALSLQPSDPTNQFQLTRE